MGLCIYNRGFGLNIANWIQGFLIWLVSLCRAHRCPAEGWIKCSRDSIHQVTCPSLQGQGTIFLNKNASWLIFCSNWAITPRGGAISNLPSQTCRLSLICSKTKASLDPGLNVGSFLHLFSSTFFSRLPSCPSIDMERLMRN